MRSKMHEISYLRDWERVSSLLSEERAKVLFFNSLLRLKVRTHDGFNGLLLHPESDKIIVS